MSTSKSLPAELDIEHFYLDPFSRTLEFFDSNGAAYSLDGKVLAGGIKLSKTASTYTLVFSFITSGNQTIISQTKDNLLAQLEVGKTYYWGLSLDNRTIIGDNFKLSPDTHKSTGSPVRVTVKGEETIRVNVYQTIIVFTSTGEASVPRYGATAARLASVGLYAGEGWLDTDQNTMYFWNHITEAWT